MSEYQHFIYSVTDERGKPLTSKSTYRSKGAATIAAKRLLASSWLRNSTDTNVLIREISIDFAELPVVATHINPNKPVAPTLLGDDDD